MAINGISGAVARSIPSSIKDYSDRGIKLYSVIASEDAYSSLIQSRIIEKKRRLDLSLFLKKNHQISVFDRVFLLIDYVDTCKALSKLFSSRKSRFYI